MNLLSFKNRFKDSPLTPKTISEVQGYLWAMEDWLSYLQEITEFNPEKRMVDSVRILNAITDTNSKLMELYQKEEKSLQNDLKSLSVVDLGSKKVTDYLHDQLNY